MSKLIHIIFKSLYLYFIAIFLLEALPLPTKGFKAGEIREINFINKIKKRMKILKENLLAEDS